MAHVHRGWGAAVLAALAIGLAGAAPAAADGPVSVYTKFDTKTCKHKRGTEEEDYGSWTCAGHAGLAVRVSAGDQRMMVSYGKAGKDDLAASQTLVGFNDAYEGTVEWRLDREGGKPFATILRWNVVKASDRRDDRPSKATGQVLVVTRLGPGGTCHVGYVDGRLNGDANELARKIADDSARGFKCGKDKRIILGKTEDDLPLPSGAE